MKYLKFLLSLSLLATPFAALNAGEKKVGDYIIYYNAFNSSFIQPTVAKGYNIPRSSNIGVLNVSIHKANQENRPDAISANVQGRAKNNLSQYEELAFREIKEGDAIYYLADFQFRNQEETRLSFTIRVPGQDKAIEISFDKKLFKD